MQREAAFVFEGVHLCSVVRLGPCLQAHTAPFCRARCLLFCSHHSIIGAISVIHPEGSDGARPVFGCELWWLSSHSAAPGCSFSLVILPGGCACRLFCCFGVSGHAGAGQGGKERTCTAGQRGSLPAHYSLIAMAVGMCHSNRKTFRQPFLSIWSATAAAAAMGYDAHVNCCCCC